MQHQQWKMGGNIGRGLASLLQILQSNAAPAQHCTYKTGGITHIHINGTPQIPAPLPPSHTGGQDLDGLLSQQKYPAREHSSFALKGYISLLPLINHEVGDLEKGTLPAKSFSPKVCNFSLTFSTSTGTWAGAGRAKGLTEMAGVDGTGGTEVN